MTAADLIAFERWVADEFDAGHILAPVHLSGGNEDRLIEIFEHVHPEDWVFSTYRSHYHALLHGIPERWLKEEILCGRSMGIMNTGHRFFSSAIVAGCLPIAVGVAAAIKKRGCSERVWCFVGDMAATTGAFHEATEYAEGHDLPIWFVVENNALSCCTPTVKAWGKHVLTDNAKVTRYVYDMRWPHVCTGKWVKF